MDLVMAVAHANTVLEWQQVLTEDELPPEWMWPLEHELDRWFTEVKRKRKERYGGDDDDDTPSSRDSGGPMMTNELARRMR